MSADINATTIAVIPDDDWIKAEVIVPVIKALNLLPVVFSIICFNLVLFILLGILSLNLSQIKIVIIHQLLKIYF